MKKIVLLFILVTSILRADPFEKGKLSLGVLLGSGSVAYQKNLLNDTQNYTLFGLYADYFIIENLSIGLGYTGWFGGTPPINQFTIPVTYYAPISERFKPYVGVYTRQTFIDSDIYDDYVSVGSRVGVTYLYKKNAYLGIGWVQDSEDGSHPELIISFSF